MRNLTNLQKPETSKVLVDPILGEIADAEAELRTAGPGWERHVWQNLIQYVNSNLNKDAGGYSSLLRVLFELTPAPKFTEFLLGEFGNQDDFFVLSELLRVRKRDLVELAQHYQQEVRNLLLWLRTPKSNSKLRVSALTFLERHAHDESWRINLSDDPIADPAFDFDEQKENPFLYFVKEVRYACIMGPICRFIFDRIEEIQNGSRNFYEAIPIVICRRPGCGNFVIPERAGRKQYCSAKCVQLVHKPSREENKLYIWLHRLKNLTPGQWRKRLREKPNDAKRLRDIKQRWPNLAENFKEVLLRAGV